MENQPNANLNFSPSIKDEPINQQQNSRSKITNSIIPILFTLFVSSTLFGIGGYYLGRQSNQYVSTYSQTAISPIPSSATPSMRTFSAYSYLLSYPKNWKFSKIDDTKQNDAIFNNQVDNPIEASYENPTDYIFGQIKLMTTKEMRGDAWKELTQEEFFNPKSKFWVIGEGIGGGPGFTQQLPQKITISEYADGMLQITHPSKIYEWVYPEQITNNYYIYFGGTPTKILMISMTYDSRAVGVQDSVNEFEKILSTLVLAPN